MFSFRTVLLLFLFALIAFVGSTNGILLSLEYIYKGICMISVNWNEFINLRSRIGESGCGSSSSWEELHDQETQRSLDNGDKFNRITLDCQTTSGGGSRAHSGSETIIDIFVGLFFLIWVAIGIWFVFVKRQKAMNAAAINAIPYSGT